ncbi:MAG: cell division protein FtsQ/DivIB [Eubacteriales bacterium]|jgi:cell division septal protein FtsQ
MRQESNQSAKKKEKKSFLPLPIRVYFVVILLVASIGLYFLLKGSTFHIDHISVSGNTLTDAETIMKIAAVPVGENIFQVNTAEHEKYIEDLYYIKKANIKRVLPSNIVIVVEEKEPIFIVSDGGNYIYLDENLVAIKEQAMADMPSIPLLSNIKVLNAQPGQKIEVEKVAVLDMAYKIALELKKLGVIDNVSEFYMTEEGGMNLYTKGGSVIRIKNMKMFEDHLQFVYTMLFDDTKPMNVELIENGKHVYKPVN